MNPILVVSQTRRWFIYIGFFNSRTRSLHVSSGTVSGPPPGEVVTSETISVQLRFKRLGKRFCIEVPVTAIHEMTRNQISQGSDSLVAFAVIGNDVKGSAGIKPGHGGGIK